MLRKFILADGREISLELHFWISSLGSGQYRISCTFPFLSEKYFFHFHLTDSQFYDSYMDFRAEDSSYLDLQEVLFNKCIHALEERIILKLEEILEVD